MSEEFKHDWFIVRDVTNYVVYAIQRYNIAYMSGFDGNGTLEFVMIDGDEHKLYGEVKDNFLIWIGYKDAE